MFCLLPDDGDITTTLIGAWAERIRSYSGSATNVINAVSDYVRDLPLETWRNLAVVGSMLEVQGCELCDCESASTLIADTTNGTPAPVQDPNDPTIWTLTSTATPNEDGYYVVRYHLPYPTQCALFNPFEGGSFSYPTSLSFASFHWGDLEEGCNVDLNYDPSVVDFYSIANNTLPCFNAFYLRGQMPFTRTVQITPLDCDDCGCDNDWCYTWDWTTDSDLGTFAPKSNTIYKGSPNFWSPNAFVSGNSDGWLRWENVPEDAGVYEIVATMRNVPGAPTVSNFIFTNWGSSPGAGMSVSPIVITLNVTQVGLGDITLYVGRSGSFDCGILSCTIRGNGVNPFEGSNC